MERWLLRLLPWMPSSWRGMPVGSPYARPDHHRHGSSPDAKGFRRPDGLERIGVTVGALIARRSASGHSPTRSAYALAPATPSIDTNYHPHLGRSRPYPVASLLAERDTVSRFLIENFVRCERNHNKTKPIRLQLEVLSACYAWSMRKSRMIASVLPNEAAYERGRHACYPVG